MATIVAGRSTHRLAGPGRIARNGLDSDRSPTVISLFCGVGGLDWGFHNRGFRVVRAIDLSRPARETYAANFRLPPESADVCIMQGKSLRGTDVILAGPPCQGFSSIGHRDPADPRNRLIVRAAQIIAAAKPRVFVIENVRGLRWHASGRFVRKVLSVLRTAGMRAEIVEVNCANLGVAQYRRRILVIGGMGIVGDCAIAAARRELGVVCPTMTAGQALLPVKQFAGKPNHDCARKGPAWYKQVIAAIGPGQKLCDTRLGPAAVHSWDIPAIFGRTTALERKVLESIAQLRRWKSGRRYRHVGDGRPVTIGQLVDFTTIPRGRLKSILASLAAKQYISCHSGRYVDLVRKFNGRFKRIDSKRPAPAVLKEFGSPRNMLHPILPRALSVRECARLQGFPDDFVFQGSVAQQFQLVANAFPPPVSDRLARGIRTVLGQSS